MLKFLILGTGLFFLAACASDAGQTSPCGTEDRTLNVGFYAYFEPISYSESEDPTSTRL